MIPKTYDELLQATESYTDVDSFLEDVFKQDDDLPFVRRLLNRIPKDIPFRRVQMYKDNCKIPKMITQYFRGVTKSQVEKAMILKVGKFFPDGFSGITIKKFPYQERWMVQIEDGEVRTLFVKTYDVFPTEDMLIYDSVFPWIFNNKGEGEKEIKPSLLDLFDSSSKKTPLIS